MDIGPILYIEDNWHNRRLVRKTLNLRGYTMVEAEDGHSGIEMIQSLKPALILLDIGLPGIGGLEVAARVKADPALREIPIIALSASAMLGDRERIMASGCDDYLSKPVHPLELLEKVEKYYRGRSEESCGSSGLRGEDQGA